MHFSTTTAALTATLFASLARAHMEMIEPAPFRGKTNPFVTNPDFNMVAPLEPSGSDFPCKGYQVDFGTASGAPTATYEAGSQQKFVLTGIEAAHNGGSCQISLSYDGGQTFKVLKSYIGNCVRSLGGNVHDPNQDYEFTVPADAAPGDAILSWTWFNQSGNREMYQNCAAVTITGGGQSKLADAPDMFVANVGNGCTVPEGIDVEFPDPGAAIEKGVAANGAGKANPTGTCGPVVTFPDPEVSEPVDSDVVEPTEPVSSPSVPVSSSVVDPSAPVSSSVVDPSAPVSSSVVDPSAPVSSSVVDPSAPVSSPVVDPSAPISSIVATPTATGSSSAVVPEPTSTVPEDPTGGDGTTYTVAPGDTCNDIAALMGITLNQIYANNPTVNSTCTNLAIGQVLTLRRRSRIMRDLA